MKLLNVTVGAGIISIAISNYALAFDGMQLRQACDSNRNTAGGVSCIAFVRGISEGLQMGLALSHKLQEHVIYCPPTNGVSAEQVRLIVGKYLRDHPQKLNQSAGFLVGDALLAAFPCKTSN